MNRVDFFQPSTARGKDALVESIIRESPAMPEPVAHRRYLHSLTERELSDRLAIIRREKERPAYKWE